MSFSLILTQSECSRYKACCPIQIYAFSTSSTMTRFQWVNELALWRRDRCAITRELYLRLRKILEFELENLFNQRVSIS